jgi:hypothetical protein
MAKLVKVQEVSNLAPDRDSMSSLARDHLLPQVQYQSMMLADLLANYDNPSIAIALSGTSDKKSKAYRAAIRSVQLWRKGQAKPGRAYQPRVIGVLDRHGELDPYLQNVAEQQSGTLNVSFTAIVTISRITEERTMHALIDAADFYGAALESNLGGFQAVAQAGGYPPLVAVYGPVNINIS